MSDFWSLAVPSWLTGAGTLGLAATTVYLTKREREGRERAEADERQRSLDARRSQARLVAAWYAEVGTPGRTENLLVLSNRSDEPVYQVVASLVLVQGAGAHTAEALVRLGGSLVGDYVRLVAVLPPGLWAVTVAGGWGGMHRAPGAEIAFTDRGGLHWVRRGLGSLDELTADAPTHYELPRPMSMTLVRAFPPATG